MKTIAALALALSLSLTACATDDDTFTGELGPRPAGKPSLDSELPPDIHGTPDHTETNTVSISEDRDIGAVAVKPRFDDGRLEWAEIDGNRTLVHKIDLHAGLDEISTFNDDGELIDIVTRRYWREEIETNGLK